MIMEFPSEEEFAKKVAEKALDEIEINGHTVRQWIHIIEEQDCIRRQTAIDACDQSINIFDATDRIRALPPVNPQEPKTAQFAKWVAEEIFDENWEYNKDAFEELACRKLAKLGIVRAKGNEWELVKPQESEEK